jgi:hypothetical protein
MVKGSNPPLLPIIRFPAYYFVRGVELLPQTRCSINNQAKGDSMPPDQPNSIGIQSLAQEAERLIEQARSVPNDKEREVLVRRARQLDVLSHLNGGLSSTK